MILTKFKHSKIIFRQYMISMKTISIFILLIYWSIMILAPVMSKDIKFSRAKPIKAINTPVSKVIR